MSEQKPAANRMTLQTFKGRLGGAKKGHQLLKKKRDALKSRFAALLKDIVDVKMESAEALKNGAFALAKANWANSGDDITSSILERAKVPAITCRLKADNVAGVSIPNFYLTHDPSKNNCETIGVAHGGAVIKSARETYLKATLALIRLASLQCAFTTLDEAIKMTGRRVNALEYVLIPKIEEVIHYITQEMDEQAREEFFRVKKVVEKKKAKLEKERALVDAENAFNAPSALDANKDSDIVF